MGLFPSPPPAPSSGSWGNFTPSRAGEGPEGEKRQGGAPQPATGGYGAGGGGLQAAATGSVDTQLEEEEGGGRKLPGRRV